MEMSKCKKHGGKPKNQQWMEAQHRGGALMRIGCVDCKAAAASQGFKSQGPPRYIRVLNPAYLRTHGRL